MVGNSGVLVGVGGVRVTLSEVGVMEGVSVGVLVLVGEEVSVGVEVAVGEAVAVPVAAGWVGVLNWVGVACRVRVGLPGGKVTMGKGVGETGTRVTGVLVASAVAVMVGVLVGVASPVGAACHAKRPAQ